MKKNWKKSKVDWLVGQWHNSGEQISVIFTIEKKSTGFHIRAVDESDREELIVSNVKWNGKVLSFETLTPSNKWRTKNCLKLISKNKALHELTFWELWKKIPRQPKGVHKKQKMVSSNKHQ